ncbi:MAG: hypothetical protein Q8L48_36795 [Archangium sp.]|nr:hypothetical protein [Archangium sp.]
MSAVPVAHVFAEVRALTRDGVVPPQLIGAFQHRLEDVDDVLQGATVAAMGLLAAARGERRHAQDLMESVAWLDERAVSASAAECALGWLVTDAAAEGEWRRLRALLPAAPQTPALRFFAHLAARVLDAAPPPPLPSDDWYQLPVEARQFSEQFRRPSTPHGVNGGSLLHRFLGLSGGDLAQVAEALSARLSSRHLRDHLMERSTLLGSGSLDDALLELREVCEAELGRELTKWEDLGHPLLRELAIRKRAALVEELDTRLDRLTDACEDGTAPPMTEVWREYVAIRHCYARAVALSEPAERGWPHHVSLRLTRYFGTWLRLTKRELPFAHAVFRFLAAEGTSAGDDTSARLARASAELCLPFQLTG